MTMTGNRICVNICFGCWITICKYALRVFFVFFGFGFGCWFEEGYATRDIVLSDCPFRCVAVAAVNQEIWPKCVGGVV